MQSESKKCQDQTGMKNDKLDDKTRWELIPLDCLEDIARVYTEGAKKYGDNTESTSDATVSETDTTGHES